MFSSPYSAGCLRKATSNKCTVIGKRLKGKIIIKADNAMPHFNKNVDKAVMDIFNNSTEDRSSTLVEVRLREYAGKLKSGTKLAVSLLKLVNVAIETDNLKMEALLRAHAESHQTLERVRTLMGL